MEASTMRFTPIETIVNNIATAIIIKVSLVGNKMEVKINGSADNTHRGIPMESFLR